MKYSREELEKMKVFPNGLVLDNFKILDVIEPKYGGKWKRSYKVICVKCGEEMNKRHMTLLNHTSGKCSICIHAKYPKYLQSGDKFGRLTVLYACPENKECGISPNKWKYHCKCTCGNEVDVQKNNLTNGHTQSCGCYMKDQAGEAQRRFNEYEILEDGLVKVQTTNKEGVYFYLYENDWDRVRELSWRIDAMGYIVSSTLTRKNKEQPIFLHRLLMNAKKKELVDHEDTNPLNNRRENLRICTKPNNNRNRSPVKKYGREVSGVSLNKSGTWSAEISHDKVRTRLGTFRTYVEAVQARFNGELEHFGKYSYILSTDIYKKYNLECSPEYKYLIREHEENKK